MAKGATFRIDRREFDKTLKEYRQYSKRDMATICNTKAFYIARRATVETQKSKKSQIRADLMAGSRVAPEAPLAALIVQARRAAAGLRGLFGKKMREAVRELIKNRRVASLASGWIPAIKAFEPLAEKRGAPRQASQAKQVGKPKGYGRPAKEGWFSKAILANLMTAKWDTAGTAEGVATPALQRAFDAEEASMKGYIERKMKESAQKAGIKTG
jgi:hypothetical protein